MVSLYALHHPTRPPHTRVMKLEATIVNTNLTCRMCDRNAGVASKHSFERHDTDFVQFGRVCGGAEPRHHVSVMQERRCVAIGEYGTSSWLTTAGLDCQTLFQVDAPLNSIVIPGRPERDERGFIRLRSATQGDAVLTKWKSCVQKRTSSRYAHHASLLAWIWAWDSCAL